MARRGQGPGRVADETFGWPALRPGQEQAMNAVLDGRDTLAVMPTGHGKSAVYQVPAVMLDGPTLVVSPLIALQRDQVASLEDAVGDAAAVAVNSSQGEEDNRDSWGSVSRGGAEFLFLSPEQLAKDDVLRRVQRLGVTLFVVDEAHCVSAWGHDFRPDYLRLGEVVERLGHPTVVALTATASPPVREEIISRLRLRDPCVVVRGFDRPNLSLEVVRHLDDAEKRRAVVEQVASSQGAGLLYVATRKDTERYAEELTQRGVRAAAYHAGRRAADRQSVHQAFSAGDLDVVVATSAFGMGIDKADVRFVVHADVPESLDSYYQEIGRAGRDGEPAVTTLHYRQEDLGLRRFFTARTPDEDGVRRVVTRLRSAAAPQRLKQLRESTGLSARKVTSLVNLLEQAGVVRSQRRGVTVDDDIDVEEAVSRAVETAGSRERVERSRLEMMRGYAETLGCRRQFLLGYFGEELDEPCGRCDACDSGTAYEYAASTAPDDEDDEFPLQASVRHQEWGPGVVMSREEDRLTVLFEQEGYRTLSRQALQENDLLVVVDDAVPESA